MCSLLSSLGLQLYLQLSRKKEKFLNLTLALASTLLFRISNVIFKCKTFYCHCSFNFKVLPINFNSTKQTNSKAEKARKQQQQSGVAVAMNFRFRFGWRQLDGVAYCSTRLKVFRLVC